MLGHLWNDFFSFFPVKKEMPPFELFFERMPFVGEASENVFISWKGSVEQKT